ncbi:MAG: flagellar basal body L-ring protein FlgH [Maricaulaceae bacterium]|jgi:flagellar L-ring protein precursor FlgH
MTRRARRIALAAALAPLALGACAQTRDRLADVGHPPDLAPMEDPRAIYGYQPVIMPSPDRAVDAGRTNSLWRSDAHSFFDDQRASSVGDILTVEIAIADEAQVSNTTSRSHANTETSELNAFLGLEGALGQVLPAGFSPSTAVDLASDSDVSGTGAVNRSETINLTVAAQITQVLPNGNFVIAGRQEVRINSEVRELLITGVARPQDITSTNTIAHTQIAEARISYGGRGVISDVQGPRYGQEAWGVIAPF